jgi:hypothetical protein
MARSWATDGVYFYLGEGWDRMGGHGTDGIGWFWPEWDQRNRME